MKKKWIIIGVIVVLGIAGSGLYIYSQRNTQVLSPGEAVSGTPTPSVELTKWTDPAGFTVQYPKELTVDKNEEDNENYAHFELTNKDHPGGLIVWVKDPPKKWPPTGVTIIDSTLGGEPAKKIITDTTLSVGCLCEDLLFLVEATLTDKEYWNGIFDTVSNSFAFGSGEPAAPGPQGSGGGGDVDEEEFVE